jgi:outer membrane protein TolC
MKKSKLIFLLFLLMSGQLFAQEDKLTIEDAVKIALEKNYDVIISGNIKQQAAYDNTIGNAGMLPNLDLNGSYTKSTNSLKQKYNTGAEVNRDAAGSTSAIGDLGLNWVVFDGMKMFYSKKKLDGLFLQSEKQLRLQMEATIMQIVEAYYSIIRNEQLLKAMQQEISLSEERLKIAQRKQNNGSGSKLDVLQAQTEFNRQRSLEIATKSDAAAARIKLNQLLARPLETNFQTIDSVIISYRPNFDEVKKELSNNTTIGYYELNSQIAELSLKENRSLRYPKVAFTSHYIFSRSTSEAGLTLLNQSNGFNYGVTASLPLFHGFNINRQINNAKIDVLNAKLRLTEIQEQINADLLNAFRNFSNNLELLQLEEQNILLAREVLSIAQERYKVGSSNNLELQDAQRTFEESMTRLADARYNAKLAETNLKQLTGKLVSLQ